MAKIGWEPTSGNLDANADGIADNADLLDGLDSTAFERYGITAIDFTDSPYVSLAGDRVVFCDTSSGNITITSVGAGEVVSGYSQTFVKSTGDANTVTVNAGTALDTQYQWETHVSDGSSTWDLFRSGTGGGGGGLTALTSVFWVSGEDGNDSNSGADLGNLKASIGSAITAASAGDVIFVLPGTYSEQLTISKSLQIVGLGDNPEDVLITSASSPTVALQAADITIANCHVQQTGAAGEGIQNNQHASVTGGTIRIVNVKAEHTGGGASNGTIDLFTNSAANEDYYIERVVSESNGTNFGLRVDTNNRSSAVRLIHVRASCSGNGSEVARITTDGGTLDELSGCQFVNTSAAAASDGLVLYLDTASNAIVRGLYCETTSGTAMVINQGDADLVGDCHFISNSASYPALALNTNANVVITGALLQNILGAHCLDLSEHATSDYEFRGCKMITGGNTTGSVVTWDGGGEIRFFDCDIDDPGTTAHTNGTFAFAPTSEATSNMIWRGGSIRCGSASKIFVFSDATWTTGTFKLGPMIVENTGAAWLENTAGTGTIENWGVQLEPGTKIANVSAGTYTKIGAAPIASIHIEDGTTGQTTNGTPDTPDVMTGWNTTEGANSGEAIHLTEDKANNKITIPADNGGVYMVAFTCSFSTGASADTYLLEAYAGGTAIPGARTQRLMNASGDVGAVSFGPVPFTVTDSATDVDVRVECDAASKTFTPVQAVLTVYKLRSTE